MELILIILDSEEKHLRKYFLSPHTYINKQKSFFVFDIETHTDNFIPYSIALYDGVNKPIIFTGDNCLEKFISFILSDYKRFRGKLFYAHNGGKFDFQFILNVLADKKIIFNTMLQGSRIFKLDISFYKNDKGSSFHFVDSFCQLPYSLEKLTNTFNVKHKKYNFMDQPKDKRDYEYLYELYKKKDYRFKIYVENDVKGLYEVLQAYFSVSEDSNVINGFTEASTSLKTFKNSYLDCKVKKPSQKQGNLMRNAYYGGNVQIYTLYAPEDKYSWYDINSCYASIMRNTLFPTDAPRINHLITKKMVLENIGITKGVIHVPNNTYIPPIPYRGNKLYFPTGKISGWYENSYYQLAKELGYKFTVEKGYLFHKSDYIFKSYIEDFYKLKKQSKKGSVTYEIAKKRCNTLYGKFAQLQDMYSIRKLTNKEFRKLTKENKILDVISMDYSIYKVKEKSNANHHIPQWSIRVSSLAQIKLFKIMKEIYDKDYSLYYNDSDCCVTDYSGLPVSKKLGDWSIEKKFITGYFLLPKVYFILKKDNSFDLRIKGYIKELQDRVKEKDFKNALFNDDYSGFTLEKPNHFLTSLTSLRRNKKFVSTDTLKKSINQRYDKRKVLKNFETKPFSIKEIIKRSVIKSKNIQF